MKINYVKQFNAAIKRARQDPDMKPYQQVLYFHLLYMWNEQHFDPYLELDRKKIKIYTGIGSTTTYNNYLKDLNKAGFIEYDPVKKARAKMLRLYEEIESPSSDTANPDPGHTHPTSETSDVPDTGHTNIINNQTDIKSDVNRSITPTLDQVINFFDMQKYTREEARSFWETFSKKDWKIRGEFIRNWKGLARKHVTVNRTPQQDNKPKKDFNES